MKLIEELVGYAKGNAEAAKTKDERLTWEAHHRNCVAVQAEIERLRAAAPSIAEHDVIENMRGDFGAGRRLMASDASIVFRVLDRIIAVLQEK